MFQGILFLMETELFYAGVLERMRGRLAWGQQNELWKGVGRKRKFAEEERLSRRETSYRFRHRARTGLSREDSGDFTKCCSGRAAATPPIDRACVVYARTASRLGVRIDHVPLIIREPPQGT
jgi:hypothetical protein